MKKDQKGPIFYRGVYIGAPAEEVWKALTVPKIIDEYYLLPIFTLELKQGGKILYGKDEKHIGISGEILEIIPRKKLVHSFSFPQIPNDPPSRVTYELEEMGKVTLLKLTHDQFPEEDKTYQNISHGWDRILSDLKTFLETGKVLPWSKN